MSLILRSPSCLEMMIRSETEVSAVSHEIVETTDMDGGKRMSRPRTILHRRQPPLHTGGGVQASESSHESSFSSLGDFSGEWGVPVRAKGHAFKRWDPSDTPLSHTLSGRASGMLIWLLLGLGLF